MKKDPISIEIETSLESASVRGAFWKVVLEAPESSAVHAAVLAQFVNEWFEVDLTPTQSRFSKKITLFAQVKEPSVDRDGQWRIPLSVPMKQSIQVGALALRTHVVFETRFKFDNKGHTR